MENLDPSKKVDVPSAEYALEARKLGMAYWVFISLLVAVNVQMLVPLFISFYRRPPDNITNNNNQINTLMVGALVGGAGFFLGSTATKNNKPQAPAAPAVVLPSDTVVTLNTATDDDADQGLYGSKEE